MTQWWFIFTGMLIAAFTHTASYKRRIPQYAASGIIHSMFIQHLALVHVLALATPQAVALHGEEMAVKPLMGIATVMQNVITLVTAVKISTALNVISSLPCLCIKQLLLLCIQS